MSLRTLNLAQNLIREGGIPEFATALRLNSTLTELCLSFNKINNQGLSHLAGFLEENHTVKVLDVSRNAFTDGGFITFAKGLAHNSGIVSINFSKNKDVTDEFGLKELAHSLAHNSSLSVIDISGIKVRKPCVMQYFQPSLKQNITLKKIIGKIPPGIINADLKDNVTIEENVVQNFRTVRRDQKRELSKLPIHRVDMDQTQLILKDCSNELLLPALKFIRYKSIQVVDLSNMQLEDEQLRHLSIYLEENPAMRSLAIAENFFTDDGLIELIQALRKNTNLNHLNLLGCNGFTDQSLRALDDMVTEVNMSLYKIELAPEDFDSTLVDRIQHQAKMNRAI
jgi:Ran GTPase-activating protein (RanGAP) involved in mRNA processing and transport